jgi:hypothetical protein
MPARLYHVLVTVLVSSRSLLLLIRWKARPCDAAVLISPQYFLLTRLLANNFVTMRSLLYWLRPIGDEVFVSIFCGWI